MSIQSLFLLNDSGEVLFEKHERGRASDRKICDWYWTEVGKRKDLGQVRDHLFHALKTSVHLK
jgi:hypothetical protein